MCSCLCVGGYYIPDLVCLALAFGSGREFLILRPGKEGILKYNEVKVHERVAVVVVLPTPHYHCAMTPRPWNAFVFV